MIQPTVTVRHYCTVVNTAYLPRFRVLLESMRRWCWPFRMHVLAWDLGAEAELRSAPWDVEVHSARAFIERGGGALRRENLPGPGRDDLEHMLTVRAAFIYETVKRGPGGGVMHLDADLMFWGSPEPMWREIGSAPAAVFPHWFPAADERHPGPSYVTHRKYGMYNAGMLFVRDPAIARDWADKCRARCSRDAQLAVDGLLCRANYLDQGYLDEWMSYPAVREIAHPGANLGPWAVHRRVISHDYAQGCVTVDGVPLVAYHYSGLTISDRGAGVMIQHDPAYALTPDHVASLYVPYMARLLAEYRDRPPARAPNF